MTVHASTSPASGDRHPASTTHSHGRWPWHSLGTMGVSPFGGEPLHFLGGKSMSSQSTLQKAEVSAWQVESLRSTAFPTPQAAQVDAGDWWEKLIGKVPENRITRAREAFLQDEGHIGNGKLVMSVQPARIDWLYTVDRDATPDKWWIGPFADAADLFLGLMSRWFDVCPPSQRLAFGAVLKLPAPDRLTGYQMLSTYLHDVTLDPEGSSDLLYQINRPRKSRTGIPELAINRLSKWAVARLGVGSIAIAPDTRAQFFPASVTFACHLELDINTAADLKGEIPKDRYMEVFRELVDLAREMLSRGDIP